MADDRMNARAKTLVREKLGGQPRTDKPAAFSEDNKSGNCCSSPVEGETPSIKSDRRPLVSMAAPWLANLESEARSKMSSICDVAAGFSGTTGSSVTQARGQRQDTPSWQEHAKWFEITRKQMSLAEKACCGFLTHLVIANP